MISIPLEVIQKRAETRPMGYLEDCINAGNICGSDLVLEDKAWRKLCRKYRKPLPDLNRILANFGLAMLEWLDAGFPVTSREEFNERRAICIPCDHWRGGGCAKCGCCDWKPWILTARCPENKWPETH